jgi:uncharacterized protein (TIGR04255 family)
MRNYEIYPKAPVALVVIEARHSASEALEPGQLQRLRSMVSTSFPLSQPVTQQKFEVAAGGAPVLQSQFSPRYVTRDQMTAVTFNTDSLVVETTNHQGFSHLMDLIKIVVKARQSVSPVEGLLRLGIRYVDEIRVPDSMEDLSGWRDWIEPSLLGPVNLAKDLNFVAEQWQGVAVFDIGQDRKLVVRYGPREGFAVAPGAPLQRATPPPGPFFLLDTDSFWSASGDVPEFEVDKILGLASNLHDAASTLFENLVTEKLKEEVFRNV